MSEARSTHVSIVLKDEASKHLRKINKLVGEVERSFMGFGQEVDDSTAEVDSLTKAVQKTNRELGDSADSADSLTRSLVKSEQNARDVQKASAKIETELQSSKKEAQALATQVATADANMGALSKETTRVETSLHGASAKASSLSGIIAGIGAGAAITGLVATVSEFESVMGRIEAKTALTGGELASVQEAVNSVYTSGIGSDLTTVTDEVARIKMSLKGLDGEELVSFSKNAMTLSDLWGESTDNVTWAVKNMTSNFEGLSETKALDLLTVGFQRTGDYSQDLLDTFKEYSPYFSKMNLSAQEFTSILISGAENG